MRSGLSDICLLAKISTNQYSARYANPLSYGRFLKELHLGIRNSMWPALVGTLSVLIAVLAPSVVCDQTTGIPTEISGGPTDIFMQFRLPSYEDSLGTRVAEWVAPLRVVRRARLLGFTSPSVVAVWNGAAAMLRDATAESAVSGPPLASIVFSGSSASALNQVVAQSCVSLIKVVSPSLSIDTPIQIQLGKSISTGPCEPSPTRT